MDIRTVQELLDQTSAVTIRCAHLAPKHTLAAVERLDARTERSTDTTTDTRIVERSHADVAVLL